MKIRKGVFETNSSSTHSLVISDSDDLLSPPFPESVLNRGFVEIWPGEYGWEIEDYYSVEDKLSYLYTEAMQTEGYDETPDPQNNYKLKMLVDAVKEQAGIDIHFKYYENDYFPYGYIDHQSIGICDELWNGGVEAVRKFIFNPNSCVHTDNDNY